MSVCSHLLGHKQAKGFSGTILQQSKERSSPAFIKVWMGTTMGGSRRLKEVATSVDALPKVKSLQFQQRQMAKDVSR
ncbi:hypothetical protein RvY_03192 [Ramazzottius varieornatus]|uniref:Uncharacterized protein n=1 Tax=Ramazzottius varieornatus TaxID=947166 RepID=A0A1D1UM67_RAMVA|nr:hypothetical protein RvY_03192 [Ramazzottius varieornatus]